MTPALPRAASFPAPATLPPTGLDGLDPAHSRLVTVPGTAERDHTWHLLDNGQELAHLGFEPVGTILAVHGNPTWSYLWRELLNAATAAALAGGQVWRVVAVDQLEMGFSERTGAPHRLEDRVRDLGALTAHMGLVGPVVTLGHDWGGVVSLGWAVDHPELLAGVMLLNTAIHQPAGKPIPAPLRLALNRSLFSAATVRTPAFLETTLALANSLPHDVRTGFRAPYRSAAARGGIGGFVADIPTSPQHPSFAELARIADGVSGLGSAGVPSLLLWGPRDPIFSDTYLDDLLNRLPDADVHRFEGAGHLLAEDVDYAPTMLDWLSTKDLRGTVLTSGEGVGHFESPEPSDPFSSDQLPMWHQLDLLRESRATALVEMAPPGAARRTVSHKPEPRVVSWRLLALRVGQIAAGLSRIGVRPGDRVSLLVPPGADLTAVLYACLRIGAVVVVADAGLGLRGLTRAVRGARPDHVIGALPGLSAARALSWPGRRISTQALPRPIAAALGVTHHLGRIAELGDGQDLPPPPHQDDQAAVLFTSGSTGPAKGVVYTHTQLCAMRDVLASQYGIGPGRGLVAGFAPFALLGPSLGACSVTPDMDVTSPKTLTARAIAGAIKQAGATAVFLSPAAIANVVATADELSAEERESLAGVELFLSAGAPVSRQLLNAMRGLMPTARAHTPYGMTEGLLVADISLDELELVDSEVQAGPDPRSGALDIPSDPGGVCVGAPTATASVRISALDDGGIASGVPGNVPGVTGEILVSATHIKDHYDRLWVTERASRVHADGAKWHRTGDVGHFDHAGRLWIEGRLAHIITTPDGVVTPVGAEQRIESLEEVSRAALVGVGPSGTQQMVVVLETRSPAKKVGLAGESLATAVRRAARTNLAAILVVPHLPTDIRHNSKIDRTYLGHWAEGILSGGRMRQP